VVARAPGWQRISPPMWGPIEAGGLKAICRWMERKQSQWTLRSREQDGSTRPGMCAQSPEMRAQRGQMTRAPARQSCSGTVKLLRTPRGEHKLRASIFGLLGFRHKKAAG